MGNYLSEPITDKETEEGGAAEGLRFGASAMQGWRVRMEDAHVADLCLGGDPAQRLSLFGVFDGHGGPEVALFCAQHVAEVLLGTEDFRRGDLEGALSEAFLALDRALAGEAGQRALRELARAEQERAREQVRGREPEVTLEEVAEQTGLSQAAIRQYVLAAWRRRPGAADASPASASSGSDEEEAEDEEAGQEGAAAAATAAPAREGGSTASSSSAPSVSVGVKRPREEEEEEEEEEHEEHEEQGDGDESSEDQQPAAAEMEAAEEGETTTTAAASDVSSGSSSSADSDASPAGASAVLVGRREVRTVVVGSASSTEGGLEVAVEEEEEEEEEVLVVQTTAEEDGSSTGTGIGTSSSSSSSSGGEDGDGEEEEEEEEEEALRNIDFRRMKDHLVRARPGYDSGSTAVVALLRGREALVVANAGDSRCVLSRGGQAVDLSRDHKPDDPLELARIRAAGGSVAEGRVEGNLNLSRALGDLTYKESRLPQPRQMITAQPEVRTLALEPADDFVVLACDGVWNVLSSQEVVDLVRAGLAQGRSPAALCEELCDRCCDESMADSEGAGLDNITALIVVLPPKDEEQEEEAAMGPVEKRARVDTTVAATTSTK